MPNSLQTQHPSGQDFATWISTKVADLQVGDVITDNYLMVVPGQHGRRRYLVTRKDASGVYASELEEGDQPKYFWRLKLQPEVFVHWHTCDKMVLD